jgi:hypothetical protein
MSSGETITEAEALRLYPELQAVVVVRQAGWTFAQHIIDNEPALVGYYNWPTFIDAVWIFERNRCIGLRMVDEAPGTAGGTVWQYEGAIDEVIHELLSLPAPGERLAPSLIIRPTLINGLWTP